MQPGPSSSWCWATALPPATGIEAQQAFPAKLETALRQRGIDVVVVNAGVSGDTAKQGLERLDWSVDEDADAVIVELGANDALRGIDPNETRKSLDEIIGRLKERNIPVMIAGMLAPPNLGAAYKELFDAIYPSLADKHGLRSIHSFSTASPPIRPLIWTTACIPMHRASRKSSSACRPKWRSFLPC